ncbi:MAG: MFS transporter [Chloroflexi bacterium]|nr:MFS transporter [Chloroflexota bacterium]
MSNNKPSPWRKNLVQQRMNAAVDHLKPQRWNWTAVIRPLDRRLAEQAADPLSGNQVRNLRYFWLDGVFAAASDNFYLGYVALYALTFGATNGQIGWLTAVGNLMGALALFPGAQLIEKVGRRKPVVLWTGGGVARLTLLGFAAFPLFIIGRPDIAILLIVLLEGTRAFAANMANPGWTSMVADLVPNAMRGRYFGSRNVAMGVAALLIGPLAGKLITAGNTWANSPVLGYQIVFGLAFILGMISTALFSKINEPPMKTEDGRHHQRGDLRKAIKQAPGYIGLIASAFVWNLSLQIAAPFFNVYLVDAFQASTTTIGLLVAVSSLTALIGQPVFGRFLDKKGALWVMLVCGFTIPVLPLGWIFITAPWQVGLINTLGGFVWAGYNLANFNLLLLLTPDTQRARAVALYQTAVFTSAVIGPLLGGYLADAVSFQLLFGLSGLGRFMGMVLFFLFAARPYQRAIDANG